MRVPVILVILVVLVALIGCGESAVVVAKPTAPAGEAPAAFLPVDSIPAEFLGNRGAETWSPASASFEVGVYLDGKPTSPRRPDAKHVNAFLKTVDGKAAELLVSHQVSSWDLDKRGWKTKWRWTLLRIVEPGKLQQYAVTSSREDRPATPGDVRDMMAIEPRMIEVR